MKVSLPVYQKMTTNSKFTKHGCNVGMKYCKKKKEEKKWKQKTLGVC